MCTNVYIMSVSLVGGGCVDDFFGTHPPSLLTPHFGMESGCYKTFGLVIVARSLYRGYPLARTSPYPIAIQFLLIARLGDDFEIFIC